MSKQIVKNAINRAAKSPKHSQPVEEPLNLNPSELALFHIERNLTQIHELDRKYGFGNKEITSGFQTINLTPN